MLTYFAHNKFAFSIKASRGDISLKIRLLFLYMYIYNLINLVRINNFDSEDMTVTREYQLSVFLLLLIHQTLKTIFAPFTIFSSDSLALAHSYDVPSFVKISRLYHFPFIILGIPWRSLHGGDNLNYQLSSIVTNRKGYSSNKLWIPASYRRRIVASGIL